MSSSVLPIRICLIVFFFLISGKGYCQLESIMSETVDTSDYIPAYFKGYLDYNLMIASSKGYSSEINRLIKKGADINSSTLEGATPLILAVSNNKIDAVRALLAHKLEIDKATVNYETPLTIAVKNGSSKIAELLIRAGADTEFKDRKGASPLHFASLYGDLEMVDMLLYYDARIDPKTTDGTTGMRTKLSFMKQILNW